MPAGRADYYKDGDWNFYCDLCGAKQKASFAMKTWDGFYVCRSHKEQRNEQDFVRGVVDDQTTQWSRPRTPNVYVYTPGNSSLLNGTALNTLTLN